MSNWLLLAGLLLPLLLGMRDPYHPPDDRCFSAQIPLWQYRGMVNRGEQQMGFMRDANGKWWRLAQGQSLENGWVVEKVQPEHMDMTAGADCEPSRWRWLKEGAQHDTKDGVGGDADGLRRAGQREPRVAGGG